MEMEVPAVLVATRTTMAAVVATKTEETKSLQLFFTYINTIFFLFKYNFTFIYITNQIINVLEYHAITI
jgi:hypothetical protein